MTKSLAGGHTAHGKEQSWEFIPIPSVAGTEIFLTVILLCVHGSPTPDQGY